MKYFLSLVVVIGAGIFLAGCQSNSPIPAANTPQNSPTAATQKSGDTTKTGKVSKAGVKFYLNSAGQKTVELDSYGVDLNQYVDQTVTVTGQYSGDTLFVGKVQ